LILRYLSLTYLDFGEQLDPASIQIALDTYSRVAPGLQEAAAESFDKLVSAQYNETVEDEVVGNNY
jgi:hypothetical protein